MPQVEGGPKGLNAVLESSYASARSQGKGKKLASMIAWSAAKQKYKKEGGKWVAKLYGDLATLTVQKRNEHSVRVVKHHELDYFEFPLGALQEFRAFSILNKSAVEWLSVDDTLVNPYNREVDREKVDAIKSKVEETGGVKPLVYTEVDKDGSPANMITDGHHRFLALKELGYGAVPAIMSDDDGVETAKDEPSVKLNKGILTADVSGLMLTREDLGVRRGPKPSRRLPGATQKGICLGRLTKGGEGSGSWEGPGQPRFAHVTGASAKAWSEPIHSGEHIKQFLQTNNVVIGSVDKSGLSSEKNMERQKEFESKLGSMGIPYKKGRGFSSQWGSESSYIVSASSKEDFDKVRGMFIKDWKQDAVIGVRNSHATLEFNDGNVKHSNVDKLEAGEHLTDNYTEVDGVRFKMNFK